MLAALNREREREREREKEYKSISGKDN